MLMIVEIHISNTVTDIHIIDELADHYLWIIFELID
jgi:hypothetical protein